jgi:hypothetical protein
MQPKPVPPLLGCEQLAGAVVGCVVDDDELEPRPVQVLAAEAVDQRPKAIAAILAADDDGDERRAVIGPCSPRRRRGQLSEV